MLSYAERRRRFEATRAESDAAIADARARGHHAMADALAKIRANHEPNPTVAIAAAVFLARRAWTAAWKLDAGLPIRDMHDGTMKVPHEDVRRLHAPRLRAEARKHMQRARDARFELALFPEEPAVSGAMFSQREVA